ncbi:uncharacterized protein KY384_002557 [Bacidia gigantensis]|uniref:uncharacterized protein n=1 Tax=Bacidia gigantensis TaxID=2732470 RepID=UPI001D03A8B2|nr:uncharacterized protein KY384_002557 [Bacidia gigantensis]KAG8532680.1 hypothetical protein KY384_002557 [Bacidia gigantensis]
MPTSSPLTIATNSVTRLLKEEEYYRKDHDAQQSQLEELKRGQSNVDVDGNQAFMLKQRELSLNISDVLNIRTPFETAFKETQKVLKRQPENIRTAKEKLERALANTNTSHASQAEVEKAKEALSKATAVLVKGEYDDEGDQ